MSPRGIALFPLLAALAASGAARAASAPVDFGRDILPILSNNCFHCHGPDEGNRKAKLRLDTHEGVLAGGKSGTPALVPGKSAGSELILRLTSPHEDEVMPPPDAAKQLTGKQIDLLKRWVDQGAPWGSHWAYDAPQLAPLPTLRDAKSTPPHPIDRFVRARLEKENLTPSPEADRRTLYRRLSFDLLGLPPEANAVQAFVDDRRPDAYERVVDAMLTSPHFGERWGRHWLDLARYADSAGYLNDTLRPYAYLYRDWVIDAINRDQPFDQFTVEQLAGDLLPNPTLEQKIATGFHRNSLKNDEAGADLELDRTKAAVDRAATTGAVWLGLTVGCAECHTHKYDPITHREFYQLYAFFNNTAERDVPAPRPDELADYDKKYQAWDRERLKLASPLEAYVATLVDTQVPAWETALQRPAARWQVFAPEEITIITEDEERIFPANDDRSISTGPRDPVRSRYVVKIPVAAPLNGVTAVRLEAIAELGQKVGRARSGDFNLAEFSAMLKTADGAQLKLAFAGARADAAAKTSPAEHTLDGDNTTGWSPGTALDASHVIVFELKAPQNFPAGSELYVELEHRIVGVLSRFRLAATTSSAPVEPSTLPDSVLATLDTPREKRTPEQTLELARHVARFADDEGKKLFAPIAAHAAKKPEYPKTAAPVLATHERKTHIHLRGDYQQPGEEVQPGTLAILHAFHARQKKADRLDLARWIVDPANPLTARVTVNHIWKHLFGRGLVATVDNFGALGERPSHPELLDWLAIAFRSQPASSESSAVSARAGSVSQLSTLNAQLSPVSQPSTLTSQLASAPPALAWSRKQLIRLIVTSATYKQSSVVRPELIERDPLNVLLARQDRHRLEAEVVRDVFLASSGLLNPKVGGPSIHPPLPSFVLAFGRNKTWPETKGADRYRRGMYIHLRRNVPYPMLTAFDASDASVACLQRERSNTPLQALTLLNDPVFFECSEKLGEKFAAQTADVDQILRAGFERCVSRPPEPAELRALRTHYDDQLRLTGGDTRLAFVATARLLMNLDEFITRE